MLIINILLTEHKLCLACMEEHDVSTVEVEETTTFKGVKVEFTATYEYCSSANDYIESEDQIAKNSLAVKDAYRAKIGFLTSEQIRDIREKYCVSQKDFSKILGWGEATITRYENHQIQDRAHDDILRRVDVDPQWFMEMLLRAHEMLNPKTYIKYCSFVRSEISRCSNRYLVNSIMAAYAKIDRADITGNIDLNVGKVVDCVNYLAQRINDLYTVKLMKLLWYSDALHFKRHSKSITGLAYSALKMGAVPHCYEQIVSLDDICTETYSYRFLANKFVAAPGYEIRKLSKEETETIDTIIRSVGNLSTKQIIDKMHSEQAYINTAPCTDISFSYATHLSIN